MPHILIVDDEENIRSIIEKYATFEGYSVSAAADGMEAVTACRNTSFDLVIMDVMMEELDGFSACREIRKFSDVPIIMLSARGEEYDRLHGFEAGVDDYVVKPFSPKELMLRIHAILNRVKAGPRENTSGIYRVEDLFIDFSQRTIEVDGKRTNLSPKEHDLLLCLVENRGNVMTRDQILDRIWGREFEGDERTLDAHIKLLRRRLGSKSHLISTLRGVGYRFEK